MWLESDYKNYILHHCSLLQGGLAVVYNLSRIIGKQLYMLQWKNACSLTIE